MNWILLIKGWITIENLFYVVSVLGIILTICTYRRNSKLERTKWLYSLYEKFYEQQQYKDIRRIIDYETEEIEKIQKGIKEGNEVKLVESLVDYLNFFEFIGSLWKMKQLSLDEIRMVFEYYINRIADFDFLVNFIRTQGFENLNALLSQLKPKKLRELQ